MALGALCLCASLNLMGQFIAEFILCCSCIPYNGLEATIGYVCCFSLPSFILTATWPHTGPPLLYGRLLMHFSILLLLMDVRACPPFGALTLPFTAQCSWLSRGGTLAHVDCRRPARETTGAPRALRTSVFRIPFCHALPMSFVSYMFRWLARCNPIEHHIPYSKCSLLCRCAEASERLGC